MIQDDPSGADPKLVASLPDKVNASGKPKRQGAMSLSDLVSPGLEPVLRARGFASMALHAHWPEIVGARLAPFCIAERLKWPPRPARTDALEMRQPATLLVRIEPAFALELSHQSGLVIERANTFLGWRCIDRLTLVQGPVRAVSGAERPESRALTPTELAELDQMTSGIDNADIREALRKLGRGILGRRRLGRPPPA